MNARLKSEVPHLKGWAGVDEVRAALGVSRQTIHLMFGRGEFKTLRRVGSVYVVKVEELEEMKGKRVFRKNPEPEGPDTLTNVTVSETM